MATTGPSLFPGATTFPGAAVYPGQGELPESWILYSTDNANVASPTWTSVHPTKVRDWDVSRGRESELADVGGGTATIVVNSHDRVIDPIANSAIHQGNRWWVRYQFSGVTGDVFKGYAEEYNMEFPGAHEAITTVSCVDEFGPLSTDSLPVTDPPRDTYQDVVMFDQPVGYWPLLYPNLGAAVVGEPLTYVSGVVGGGGSVYFAEGAIVGQIDGGYLYTAHDDYYQTGELTYTQSGDAGGLSEFTIEGWISIEGTPSGTELLLSGPQGIPSHTYTWKFSINTSRQIVLQAKNTSGTVHTATSSTSLTSASIGSSNVWYHVVGTITGGNLRLYINGTQEASTAWTGSFEFIDNAFHFIVGNAGTDIGASNFRAFDELAFYRVGLTAARVSAHYTAGRLRGFARQQDPGDRVNSVLDAASNLAPRSIQTGTRNMIGTYMIGQTPLEEMRKAETAESVDAVLFVAANGTVTLLADGHRTSSPYNTVQATFDDDGTDLPYLSVTLTPSNAFLANIWNATRVGGTLTTVSDTTSITKHGRRTPQTALTDLPITADADVTAIAAAMLAKYKDPLVRISALNLDTSIPAVSEAVLGLLDIGSRVRVFRTHPGGGARIDQTSFVQSVKVSAVNDGKPWAITLGVSPL